MQVKKSTRRSVEKQRAPSTHAQLSRGVTTEPGGTPKVKSSGARFILKLWTYLVSYSAISSSHTTMINEIKALEKSIAINDKRMNEFDLASQPGFQEEADKIAQQNEVLKMKLTQLEADVDYLRGRLFGGKSKAAQIAGTLKFACEKASNYTNLKTEHVNAAIYLINRLEAPISAEDTNMILKSFNTSTLQAPIFNFLNQQPPEEVSLLASALITLIDKAEAVDLTDPEVGTYLLTAKELKLPELSDKLVLKAANMSAPVRINIDTTNDGKVRTVLPKGMRDNPPEIDPIYTQEYPSILHFLFSNEFKKPELGQRLLEEGRIDPKKLDSISEEYEILIFNQDAKFVTDFQYIKQEQSPLLEEIERKHSYIYDLIYDKLKS